MVCISATLLIYKMFWMIGCFSHFTCRTSLFIGAHKNQVYAVDCFAKEEELQLEVLQYKYKKIFQKVNVEGYTNAVFRMG